MGGPPKRPKKNIDATKKGRDTAYLHFGGKCGQLGSKLPSKTDPESIKIRSKNRSKKLCVLGSIFGRILDDFGRENENKCDQNRSKVGANCGKRFFDKSCSPCIGGSKNEVRGVQVAIKNRSKIKQNLRSRMDVSEHRCFSRF